MKWARDRFLLAADPASGGSHKYWTTRCSCGFVGRVSDSSHNRLPPEMIAKKLQARGWALGSNANRDTCPSCSSRGRVQKLHKPALTPAQKRAAFCAINNVPRAQPKPPEVPVTAQPQAEAPRQPTPSDRQRVYAAIEDRWDADNESYLANWSDASVSEALKVPRAWVTDVRVLLFGAEDRNMAAAVAAGELQEVRAQFDEIEKVAMASMQATMDAMEKVKASITAIERRLNAKAA